MSSHSRDQIGLLHASAILGFEDITRYYYLAMGLTVILVVLVSNNSIDKTA